MRFLVDANLPPRLVGWLIEQGHEAGYSDDLLGPSASDTAIFAAAEESDAVIVSKDRDFRLLVQPPPPPQLLWVRLGNATNARLVALCGNWRQVNCTWRSRPSRQSRVLRGAACYKINFDRSAFPASPATIFST